MIRQASADEMLALWGDDPEVIRPTTAFFSKHIDSGNATFWAYDYDGELVGELYVFRSLDDNEFANGNDRAYLSSFRVREDFRGKGLGTKLLNHVLDGLRNEGVKEVTIGVGDDEEDNIRLYRRLGFTEKVKNCFVDPCDVDEHMQPKATGTFWLLKRDI